MFNITRRLMNKNTYMQKAKFSNNIENELKKMQNDINEHIHFVYVRVIGFIACSTLFLYITLASEDNMNDYLSKIEKNLDKKIERKMK